MGTSFFPLPRDLPAGRWWFAERDEAIGAGTASSSPVSSLLFFFFPDLPPARMMMEDDGANAECRGHRVKGDPPLPFSSLTFFSFSTYEAAPRRSSRASSFPSFFLPFPPGKSLSSPTGKDDVWQMKYASWVVEIRGPSPSLPLSFSFLSSAKFLFFSFSLPALLPNYKPAWRE